MATRRARSITCSKCFRILPERCTWATCATTRLATRWRVTSGCADSTCCIRWVGTRSVCRRKTPPSSTASIRANGPTQTSRRLRRVLRRFGFSYDWRREISTCEPEYYRWNQWFFLRMLENGIAFRKKSKVNWCPQCATVLANEQVERRFLLAARNDSGGSAGARAMVPAHHAIFGSAARRHEGTGGRLARARPGDAAELDWKIARGAGAVPGRGDGRRGDRSFHHAHRHDLRRGGAGAFRGTSRGAAACGWSARAERHGSTDQSDEAEKHARCGRGDGREGRIFHRAICGESVFRRKAADLDRKFRAGGLWHRRGDGAFRRTISAITSLRKNTTCR